MMDKRFDSNYIEKNGIKDGWKVVLLLQTINHQKNHML